MPPSSETVKLRDRLSLIQIQQHRDFQWVMVKFLSLSILLYLWLRFTRTRAITLPTPWGIRVYSYGPTDRGIVAHERIHVAQIVLWGAWVYLWKHLSIRVSSRGIRFRVYRDPIEAVAYWDQMPHLTERALDDLMKRYEDKL